MEIRIHTSDRSVERFLQEDPALVTQILDGLQSKKLFTGNIITVAGDYSLTTFVTAHVNRVDLITNKLAGWKFPADILDVVEVSEDEYRERSHLNDPSRLERRRNPKQAGDVAVVFAEVEMAGSARIFLAGKIKVALQVERLQRFFMLFSAPAVHFRLPQGGVAILNLRNLVRTTFNPGPDVTPIDAWPAHHLLRQPGPVCISDAIN